MHSLSYNRRSTCTTTERLVTANFELSGFSLKRLQGLVTFEHEQLNWALYRQSLPTLDTEWLRVDVDEYKIISIYNSPPTRLQPFDLPVFPQPSLYAVDFNLPYTDSQPVSISTAGKLVLTEILLFAALALTVAFPADVF